MNIFLSF